ncbi:hypothetical protein Zmor_000312 [Zophobas morio]|uniref:Uncharacterized protein n=1 Tax=Zophobas morio TaxID=2755281 RepID=A0AA38J5T8_9CUCU|nr:hypothetical protein Zmor_000312 [Zophobas morio]
MYPAFLSQHHCNFPDATRKNPLLSFQHAAIILHFSNSSLNFRVLALLFEFSKKIYDDVAFRDAVSPDGGFSDQPKFAPAITPIPPG